MMVRSYGKTTQRQDHEDNAACKRKGRPQRKWLNAVEEDLRKLGLRNWMRAAKDRKRQRGIVQCVGVANSSIYHFKLFSFFVDPFPLLLFTDVFFDSIFSSFLLKFMIMSQSYYYFLYSRYILHFRYGLFPSPLLLFLFQS